MSEVFSQVRRWMWAPLVAISLAMVTWGLQAGEFATVKSWFDQLCASCIGLTGR